MIRQLRNIGRDPPRFIAPSNLAADSLAVFCQQRMLPNFTLGRELQQCSKGCF